MKKKVIALILFLVFGVATWFGTSYALNGNAKKLCDNIFGNEQVEEETPEEEPGDGVMGGIGDLVWDAMDGNGGE